MLSSELQTVRMASNHLDAGNKAAEPAPPAAGAGSSAATLSAQHHRLARSSSMGPEDELVSCFPGE